LQILGNLLVNTSSLFRCFPNRLLVELTQLDVIPRETPPRRPYRQPAVRTISLSGGSRFRLPRHDVPRDIGEEDTSSWSTGEVISDIPPSQFSGSSFSSRPKTAASDISTTRSSGRQRRPSIRYSIPHLSSESERQSALNDALTTRVSTWESRGKPPRIIKATMKGLLQFLLQSGKRYTILALVT
jgi:hypothetical protein